MNSIFEALNGRGKTLDDLDLIRNHLYSYFADSANEVRRSSIHESIESTLAITRTPVRSEMYFRCFFQCEYGFLHKGRFYRDTRACIRAEASSAPTGDYVYELITRLTDAATVELFRTMTAVIPDKDLLANFLKCSKTGAAKRNLSTFLRELRHYTVTYPLLFSLLRRFVHESDGRRRRRVARIANDFIRDLTSFIMRLSFCLPKFEPSRLEPAIAECSHLITRASDIADVDLRDALCKLDDIGIMHDTRFVDYMSNVRIADARRVKRLLFGISHRFQPDSSVLRIDGIIFKVPTTTSGVPPGHILTINALLDANADGKVDSERLKSPKTKNYESKEVCQLGFQETRKHQFLYTCTYVCAYVAVQCRI